MHTYTYEHALIDTHQKNWKLAERKKSRTHWQNKEESKAKSDLFPNEKF